ncbi:MAG: pantoate--beta-alanine ligase [Deltaproteobacteria bacterium]|nr:pantoate--beta-alanine ligase [Deltaproteobacteria bacterium]
MVEVSSIDEMRGWSERQRAAGLRVGFVPTMGYLHEGHLSLVRAARERCDRVVVSIFVNPIQFDREDDLVSYPRDLERDRRLLAEAGVDVLFVPGPREMYPDDFVTTVDVERLTTDLCGAHRPGHFRGVTTVVAKLFHAVRPDVAVFGQKDWQQVAVVRRMARDLDFGIEVVAGPTVREGDGLALSSRNARLSGPARAAAIAVPTALDAARLAVADGARTAAEIDEAIRRSLASEPAAKLEYARVVDPDSLEAVDFVRGPVQLAVAIWVGGVRLIDNVRIDPAEGSPEPIARALPTLSDATASTDPQTPAALLAKPESR